MSNIISEEELKDFEKIEGGARGMALKTIFGFILQEEGEKGLKKLEENLAELGYPIKYKTMKSMDFFSLTFKAILLLSIKRVFDYNEENFQEMGRFGAKFPLVVRRVMKNLFSINKISKEGPKIWSTYFTKGEFELKKLNPVEKYMVVTLKDFRVHPLECEYLKGLFSAIAQIVVKEPVVCEETKCPFRGDEYYEFLIRW
ncbi:MAG: hypothetical protein GF370_03730 [Candidatus Nealsonbacteria bacterium]|nr:hypothetical protein [Candidatus Nealsonbacteria bacterium]